MAYEPAPADRVADTPAQRPAQGLTQGPAVTRRAVLALAVPIIFASIGVSLSGIADTAVMGRMPDPVYLSATAIGATFFATLYGAVVFLRMSTGGLVAQAFGADDAERQRRLAWRAIVLAASLGLVIIVLQAPLLWLSLRVMDDAGGMHALVRDYVGVRVWSAPAVLMLFVLHGVLVGRQSMRALLGVQLVQTLLNVALNIVLFTQTELGIRGVALATVIADLVAVSMGLSLLWPLLRGDPDAGPGGKRQAVPAGAAGEPFTRWLFEPAELRRLFSIGGNLFVRSLCLTGAYFWFTAAGTRLGVTVVAANAILMQLLLFTSFFLDGFAHAAEALVGQAIGQRRPAALRAAVRVSAELSLLMAIGLCAVFAIGGGVFIDALSTDAATREATRAWLGWAIALPIAGVGSFLLDGVFIGATRTRAMRDSMVVSLLLFVLATQVLIPAFGNHGLWAAFLIMLLARVLGLGLALPGLLRGAIDPARPATSLDASGS